MTGRDDEAVIGEGITGIQNSGDIRSTRLTDGKGG